MNALVLMGMATPRMNKETVRWRIISATLDEDVIREMHRVKKETGLSVSSQIQLALKGGRGTRGRLKS